MKKSNRQQKKAAFLEVEGNYIIPVMGPTGAGKSTFINQLLGETVVQVGHTLHSCTSDLNAVNIDADIVHGHIPVLPKSLSKLKKVIIVDTPGFDDTTADDSEILRRIAFWLADTYGEKAKLAGVIYLQDICQRRVTGATKRNFDVFNKLCGSNACKSIVLGTTQWARIPPKEADLAAQRESELENTFWKDMIRRGSTMDRVGDDQSSAWRLVRTVLLQGGSTMLQIQDELRNAGKSLPQTAAAQVLRERIEEVIKSMRNGGATKDEIQGLVAAVSALKPSLGSRLRSFLHL